MGFLSKLKTKMNSKLNTNYPNAIEVYKIFKSNNQEFYSKHKIKSLLFLKKVISNEKKGKDVKLVSFPKNTINPFNLSVDINKNKNTQLLSKELAEKLLKYDVISFDIFDTCIFRKLDKPSDLFDCLEKEFDIRGFKDIRIKAELNARAKTKKPNGEIDIYDIYDEILKVYPSFTCQAEKEIDLELNYCYANSYMLEVFNILKENNKTIIAISDMYLPKTTIEKILNKSNFIGFDNLFVSNEHKCNKGNGKLFKVAQKIYKNKKIIHIGDNYFADVLGSKKVKIDSFYYQK